MRPLIGLVVIAGAAALALLLLGSFRPAQQVEAGPISAPAGVYDPVRAGEPTPPGFRQLLPRDAIFPVYNPTFKTAGEIDWPGDALVIGLELDGDAKAYPVSFLNRREMVIDWIGGTPVLVTW